MMTPHRFTVSKRNSNKDLLPNEQIISFERIQIFLAENKVILVISCLAILMVLFGSMSLYLKKEKKHQEAKRRYATAKTPESLQAVIQEFSGTEASLLAMMSLGDPSYQKKEWTKAAEMYQKILNQSPKSTLAPFALFSLACISEATDKTDEAVQRYQSILSTYPDSFQAPPARLALTRLLESQGKMIEAKQIYEEFLVKHPQSSWKDHVTTKLERINQSLKK